jgi:hypothetical protein
MSGNASCHGSGGETIMYWVEVLDITTPSPQSAQNKSGAVSGSIGSASAFFIIFFTHLGEPTRHPRARGVLLLSHEHG